MRRKLFSFAALLSLLLCVATVVLWVRSYWYRDQLINRPPNLPTHFRSIRVATSAGTVLLGVGKIDGVAYTQTVAASPGGYTHVTRNVRYVWTPLGNAKPFPPTTTGLGFGTDTHGLLASEPLPIGPSGTSITLTYRMGTESTFMAPLWSCAVTFGILPAASLVRWLRARRRSAGCPSCGYNLTGNTSGVCPECGTAIPQPSRPA